MAPRPPRGVLDGERGFAAARRHLPSSCLIDAHLRQGWHAARGEQRLLHVGVRPGADGFGFHAWLEGDDDDGNAAFVVLMSRTEAGLLHRPGTPQSEQARQRPVSEHPRAPTLVSVIMPAYNAAPTIGMQLEALARQTYSGPWELLVVDDGSSDRTAEDAQRTADQLGLSLRVVHNRRRLGRSSSVNAGADAAGGDLLAFCDADDVVSPAWLSELVAAAGDADQVGGFYDSHTLNAADRDLAGFPADRLPQAGTIPFAVGGNMAVWADVFTAVAGCRARYRRNGDIELSARLRRHGFRVRFAPHAVVYYRHTSSALAMTRTQLRTGIDAVALYRDLRADGLTWSFRFGGRAWLRLLLHLPAAIKGPKQRRLRWVGQFAYRMGRLLGSLRWRTAYL